MNLQSKFALVTGASRGIGRAVAPRPASDGAAVVVNYAGSEQQAREVVAGIEKAGHDPHGDVSVGNYAYQAIVVATHR